MDISITDNTYTGHKNGAADGTSNRGHFLSGAGDMKAHRLITLRKISNNAIAYAGVFTPMRVYGCTQLDLAIAYMEMRWAR